MLFVSPEWHAQYLAHMGKIKEMLGTPKYSKTIIFSICVIFVKDKNKAKEDFVHRE